MVLACSFSLVSACGVELNGLFDGDDIDGASPRDGGRDAMSVTDRALDGRFDASADGSSSDGSSIDQRATDVATTDLGRRDATGEPAVDVSADGDAPRDVSIDGRDAAGEGDAVSEARPDGDGVLDMRSEPLADTSSEDATVDAGLDVVDAATDARGDVPGDGADAEPPISCTGRCNTFDNISPTITRTVVQGSPPAMTGGAIVDGTYVVSSIVHYNGDTSLYSLAETSVITGNFDAWVASTNGQAPTRYTTTFTTAGNQMVLSICCPTTTPLTLSYTTNGTTLTHVDVLNPNRVITYTRQ